jgi:hypothetical protein
MGEAKRRRASEMDNFEAVNSRLCSYGVDTSQFGFYDQPNFLARERQDSALLEQYAKWVLLRPRDDAYDRHVRDVAPRLSNIVVSALEADGYERGCVFAAGMLTRMLDRLGVWSFAVAGSTTLEVKNHDLWRGLHIFDDPDFPGAELGHVWVVAPPYRIIDTSISLQSWTGDSMRDFVPRYLLVEAGAVTVNPTADSVVSAKVRARYAREEGRADPQLQHRLYPRLRHFGRDFPALETTVGELRIRYVPVAIRQTDVPLELINSEGTAGRPAIDIWRDEVAPAFGLST